jgi:hypothetical protein
MDEVAVPPSGSGSGGGCSGSGGGGGSGGSSCSGVNDAAGAGAAADPVAAVQARLRDSTGLLPRIRQIMVADSSFLRVATLQPLLHMPFASFGKQQATTR